jgi:hypothetical protein
MQRKFSFLKISHKILFFIIIYFWSSPEDKSRMNKGHGEASSTVSKD